VAKVETPYDENRSYPWGNNTATYKIWLAIIVINVIALSVIFVATVEIPAIQEQLYPGLIEKGSSGSLIVGNETDTRTGGVITSEGGPRGGGDKEVHLDNIIDIILKYCIWIMAANIVLAVVLKTVGKWLTSVEKWCKALCKCKWYKPWCCLGRLFCWFVTVTKWVTWLVAVTTSVITSVLTWVCF
jgi:hypothetical protein